VDKFLLLVDDQGRIEPVLERALKGSDVSVRAFLDIATAKRSLIEATPMLIVTSSSFQTDPDGGFRFAKEVSAHSELSKIPLLLLSEDLSEDVIRRASESGAKALVPWPVSVESLKKRIAAFFPQEQPLSLPADSAASPQQQQEQTPSEKAAPLQASSEEKVRRAQHLLAQVLHNLKTSALLEVIDIEDVPRVVSEITRAVCGVAAPRVPRTAAVEAQPEDKPEVELDLAAVFGMKK
jgi:DNA-binding response OmpR family regulator